MRKFRLKLVRELPSDLIFGSEAELLAAIGAREYEIDGTVFVGRDAKVCKLAIGQNDPERTEVSAIHAYIIFNGETRSADFSLVNAPQGIRVDGLPVEHGTLDHRCETIAFGELTFRIVFDRLPGV